MSTNSVVFTDWDKEQDFNYVLKTWILGVCENFNGMVPKVKHEMILVLEPKLKAILNRSDTNVKICYSDEDCIIILSFAVYSPTHLYFIHTKPKFRHKGLARNIIQRIDEKPEYFIENNMAVKNQRLVKALNLTFDPTILFGGPYEENGTNSVSMASRSPGYRH